MGQIALEFDGAANDFRFLSTPLHADVTKLIAYWHLKRGQRSMPERTDIIPREIITLLPYIVIYDVLDDGTDFRVRVFGTALVELVGEERTGKRVSEFGDNCNPPTNAEIVRRRWMDSLSASYASGNPECVTGLMSSSHRSYIAWHGVSCPMGIEGQKPTQMLGLMVPEL
ncbi:MAG: PAS domain-containing protein [Parvibaculum sp.]|nr:PAS domain-containing protein [Parvibaculum sp.]